ncbi:MAG: hypothetical protein R8G66_17690 [Cytophagales bacterium]|nr:hypothetical protein [Cytophagales bacterium]
MANLVKTKKSIFFGSVAVIIALMLSNLSWLKTEIIKKWDATDQLVWSDFNGDIPWGTAYDAGISSKVYAIPDSSGAYEIYAGQNNLQSWTKHKRGSEDLLRHEQYHFNITELHARMLRQLVATDSAEELDFDSLKFIVDTSLDKMQDRYDQESNHSLIRAYQHLWEYQVDSMLSAHEVHQGYYDDRLGGAKVWFPSQPLHEEERNETFLSDCYTSSAYWADLSFCVYHDMDFPNSSFTEDWETYLLEEAMKIQEFSHSKARSYEKLDMIYDDTVNQWHYQHKVYFIPPYEYRMRTAIPMNDPNSQVYQHMSAAFLNNFSFEDQEHFWLDISREKYPAVVEKELGEPIETDSLLQDYLSVLPYSDYSIAYHRPIKDGSQLIIPFKIVRHPIDDVSEILYMINENRTFSQAPDSPYQVLKIDIDLLQAGENKIQFGYTTLSDSLTNRHHFYSSIVTLAK